MPSVTWDTSFEQSPADTDLAKYGAEKLRDLKIATREREELEHNFQAGTKPFHLPGRCSVAFYGTTAEVAALSSPPQYAVAFDTTLRSWKYYDGAAWVRGDAIPSGTKMVFYQASAPTGWTMDTSLDDRVLRVVNTNGGSTGGSWVISGLSASSSGAHTHGIGDHTHSAGSYSGSIASSGSAQGGCCQVICAPQSFAITGTSGTSSGTTSSDGAHGHTISQDGSWRPACVNVIVCTKD
jgi:hypothetical protein